MSLDRRTNFNDKIKLPLSTVDAEKLIEELKRQQLKLEKQNIELEEQNRQLIELHEISNSHLANYTELYDFASCSFFSFDKAAFFRVVVA